MKIVRDDILKNAFENGLKAELLQGYENRIPADATYEVAVTTATDIENIQARKKSLSSKNRQSELSAISLHQELLTSDVEELKRKFEGLNFQIIRRLGLKIRISHQYPAPLLIANVLIQVRPIFP
jgi:hypothetical protein